ncbi:NAD(P)-binding protein [Schizophyllum amplum]|uniref:NAD(P)-binding protein n=1 Tax=Schizophyllum amplum TaxID=97359 RepID=A0A550CPH6_9AGAR|nr:NAD(P)-binding protein [Auriculariopsis ampla]
MSPIVYLISGANRGIGLGLVEVLAKRVDIVVFAGARSPSTATKLRALAEAHPGKVHVIKLTSADRTDNEAAIAEVKRVASRLDVVIANAGISDCYATGLQVPPEAMISHFEVNVNGPLVLFQSAYQLMRASTSTPKFVPVSSIGGTISLGATFPGNIYPYGASKAALNWVSRKLHNDHLEFIVFPINPGGVETDMIRTALKTEKWMQGSTPFATPKQSATDILSIIDKATRESVGGRFMDVGGETLPW